MKHLIPAFLALLIAAGGAVAQDRPSPGVPLPRGKDRVRMVPPKESPEKPGPGEPEKPKEPPVDPVAAALDALSDWPSAEAREAAAALSLRGPEMEPRLIAALPDAPPARAAGICYVLGEIGGDASIAATTALAGRPSMAGHLGVVFTTLGKLDGLNAVRRVLPYLKHPKRPARESAENWLREHLDASAAPRVEEYTREESRGARLSALRLLDRIAPERAEERAFAMLGDEAPEVARTAAEIVASRADEGEIRKLNGLVDSGRPREAGYALLTLALVLDRTGELPYDRGLVPTLLGNRGLRSVERLNQGAAAIALADIGYGLRIPEVDAVLDRDVVLTLLRTLGGPSFYKDYGSLAGIARDRFGKLSGIRERRPVPALWRWWEQVGEDFTARRALKEIRSDAMDGFRVKARSVVEPPLTETVFSTVAADASSPDLIGVGFVLLDETDAADLARLVSENVLALPGGAALESDRSLDRGIGPDITLTVTVANRSRTVRARAESASKGLLATIRYLAALRDRYAWQRYWDRDTYPRFDVFIEKEAPYFATGADPKKRDERLKKLILLALDDLTTQEERGEALALLGGLDVTLTDGEAYRLALYLEAEQRLTLFAERIVEVLGRARKPLVVPIVSAWFEKRQEPRSRDLFVDLLASYGADEVEVAAASDRIYLRRAAVAAASRVLAPEELRKLLEKALGDENPTLRREALLALGESGLPDALSMIEKQLADENQDVSYAAIEAMGHLRTPEAVSVLSRELKSDDMARRVAAVQALCATGLKDAEPVVLSVLAGEPSALLKGVAAREIVKFGVEALGGLSGLVMDTEREAEVRSLAVEALVKIGGDHVSDILEALLGDADPEVADAAAFALAGRARKDAVPRLLAALEEGRNPVRAVAALEQISVQSFPTARAEELPAIYRGWWGEHQHEPESAWFVRALVNRGYDEASLESLSTGRPSHEVYPPLIRALAEPDWFVRANANLWLVRLAGRSFGEISRFSSPDEVREIQTKWRLWLEEQ